MERVYYKLQLFCKEASLWKDWLHSDSNTEQELQDLKTRRDTCKRVYPHIESRILSVHEQVVE